MILNSLAKLTKAVSSNDVPLECNSTQPRTQVHLKGLLF